jgi:hypothetical protein
MSNAKPEVEPEEEFDLPPLSSYTVNELKQLLSMTRQAYDAYVSQGTESGKIGAKLCADEIKELETLITAAEQAQTLQAQHGTPAPDEHPSCK